MHSRKLGPTTAIVAAVGILLGAGLSHFFPATVVLAAAVVILPCLTFVALIWGQRGRHQESLTLSRKIEEAVHQERERIYRNLHDDLGSQLLSLVYQAPDETVADQARVALQSLREDIARTLDKRLTLLELLGDLRSEMEMRLTAHNIALQWDVPVDMPDSPVQVQNVITISRILREAVSNVIKHADASEVVFSVSSLEESIEIAVRDNGSGLGGPTSSGRGLESMNTRAQQLGGELVFEETGSGCRVGLMLPR
ncbi:MAG: ATP-binding protein [Pseudomonadota bacterium]